MELFYRKTGNGAPLVILHGLYGSSDNWMSIARLLEDRYTVYMVDHRNHGSSPHMTSHTYSDMVQDLLEFVTQLHLEDIVLLGHSMGGKVAMLFSLEYPKLVSKLIVVDIAPKNYTNASNFGQETTNHQFILASLSSLHPEDYTSRKDMDNALKSTLSSSTLRAFLLKNIKRTDDGKFAWRLNLPVLSESIDQIMDGFSVKRESSDVPALFVKGQHSTYIQTDDQFFINNLFPASQLVTLPNTGHWVHAEQPRLLVNTITYFLG